MYTRIATPLGWSALWEMLQDLSSLALRAGEQNRVLAVVRDLLLTPEADGEIEDISDPDASDDGEESDEENGVFRFPGEKGEYRVVRLKVLVDLPAAVLEALPRMLAKVAMAGSKVDVKGLASALEASGSLAFACVPRLRL